MEALPADRFFDVLDLASILSEKLEGLAGLTWLMSAPVRGQFWGDQAGASP